MSQLFRLQEAASGEDSSKAKWCWLLLRLGRCPFRCWTSRRASAWLPGARTRYRVSGRGRGRYTYSPVLGASQSSAPLAVVGSHTAQSSGRGRRDSFYLHRRGFGGQPSVGRGQWFSASLEAQKDSRPGWVLLWSTLQPCLEGLALGYPRDLYLTSGWTESQQGARSWALWFLCHPQLPHTRAPRAVF